VKDAMDCPVCHKKISTAKIRRRFFCPNCHATLAADIFGPIFLIALVPWLLPLFLQFGLGLGDIAIWAITCVVTFGVYFGLLGRVEVKESKGPD
jgi:hypothetical protein